MPLHTESSANTERLKKGPSNDILSSSLPLASDKGLGSHEGSLTIFKKMNDEEYIFSWFYLKDTLAYHNKKILNNIVGPEPGATMPNNIVDNIEQWTEICDYIATRYTIRHNKRNSGFVKWMKSPHKDYIHDPTFRHSGLVSSSGVIGCWNSWPYIRSRWRHLPTRCKYSCGK